MKKKINTKLILAGAFLSALVFPFLAGANTYTSEGTQSITLKIDKAVDFAPPSGGAVALASGASQKPLPTSAAVATNTNVAGTGLKITDGFRSNAAWNLAVVQGTRPSGLVSDIQVKAGTTTLCGGSFASAASSQTIRSGGPKNTDNSRQLTTGGNCDFQYSLSWGDEGGTTHSIPITTTLSN